MAHSLLAEVDGIRAVEMGRDIFDLAHCAGRDVPSLPLIGDDSNSLPVVWIEHAQKRLGSFRVDRNAVAD